MLVLENLEKSDLKFEERNYIGILLILMTLGAILWHF
jgi:hypothetical protein